MEDLRNYKEYREELMAMRCEEVIVRKIAEEIAIVHTNTHKQVIGEQAYQHMVKQFTNPSLMSITDQYVFTRPFTKDDETNRSSERVKQRAVELVYSDPNVIAAAKAMQEIFHNKKECLVHGDLHTESIMNTNNDCKIIDLEFAFVGPPAVDIGFLLANYMFSYYGHMSNPENHDERRKFANSLIDTCKLTVSTYLDNMPCHEGDRAVFISDMLAEIAGFAGCELVRRTVGAAHVKDIEGNDDACIDSMGAGVRLLLARERIHTVDKLMVIALMLT